MKVTTEMFIERCKKVHGDRYDYSITKYEKSNKNVKIICKVHGEFEQLPNNHLKSNGCIKCGGKLIFNKEDFITECNKIHNYQFNYDNVIYVKSTSKVDIVCQEHGIFSMKPLNHIQGQKCPKCSPNRIRYTTDEYINKLKIIHNNYYDYSKLIYIKGREKVEIICPKHG